MLGEWKRTGPDTTQKEEIRAQYQSKTTKRWREFGNYFSSEENALRWAAQMLSTEGDALGVRIYRETRTIEVIHNLVAAEEAQ